MAETRKREVRGVEEVGEKGKSLEFRGSWLLVVSIALFV